MPSSESLPATGRFLLYGFALWTAASHVTVLTGGGLYRLVTFFLVLTIASLAVSRFWQSGNRVGAGRARPETSEPSTASEAPGRSRIAYQGLLVLIVAAVAVIVTLCAHRPNLDDSLYISFSIAAADDPSAPILHRPTLHSIGEPRFFLPSYKVHSLEMLVAAVSTATGIEPIAIFHLILAPIAAGLCILSFGVLFRRLTPGRHGQAALAAFVFLLAMADVNRALGNFGFVRLHQGKGILLTVMVPVLVLVGLAFVRRPGKRQWLDLCAAQIAAVGLTANGLMVGPTVAGMAVLSGLAAARQPVRRWPTLALALAASAYPLAVGVLVSIRMQYVFQNALAELEPNLPAAGVRTFLLAKAEVVFGAGPFAGLCLILVLAGWRLADRGEARSVAVIFPLGLLTIFLNPIFVPLVARYVVSDKLYWRVFWILPLAILAGVAAAGPLHWGTSRRRRLFVQAAYVLALALILFVVPERTTLSKANGTRMGFPGLKVPPEFEVARAIRDDCPEQSNVLAPAEVSPWITTLSRHPYPLFSRPIYGYSLGEELRIRRALTSLVSGERVHDKVRDVLPEELRRMNVRCVAFTETADLLAGMSEILTRAGYDRRASVREYEIWRKNAPAES